MDGTDAKTVNNLSSAYLNVSDGKIYYCHNFINDSSHGQMYVMNTDGSGARLLGDSSNAYLNIAGGYLFYWNKSGGGLCQMDLDGRNPRPVN